MRTTRRAIFSGLAFLCLALATLSGAADSAPTTQKEFKVTEVVFKADDPKPGGPCPITVKFSGHITTNSAGTVRYTFARSDGATAPISVLEFEEAGTQEVTATWTLGGSNLPSYEGWQTIMILSPNEMESSRETGAFAIDCGGPMAERPQTPNDKEKPAEKSQEFPEKQPTEPEAQPTGKPTPEEVYKATVQKEFRVTEVVLKADNPNLTGQCPLTVNFTGYITANGAGTVKYTFARSDGATGPVETIEFKEGGTQRITTSWTLGGKDLTQYKGWQTIKTLSPNERESSIETGAFSIDCEGQLNPTPKPPIEPVPVKPPARREGEPAVIDPRLVNPRAIEQIITGGCVHDPAAPRVDGWDFEGSGALQGWTAEGDAFSSLRQPTLGDNVTTDRVITAMRLDAGGIGGDYWKKIPHPIGHQGQYWIGTYENHPTDFGNMPLGSVVGDTPTGTLTSPLFCLDKPFINFLIGGGNDVGRVKIELLLRTASGSVEATQIRQRGGELIAIGGEQYWVASFATGLDRGEMMRPHFFDVSQQRGRTARLRLIDNSPNHHLNIDDIKMADSRPATSKPPIWGFVDTHTHPSNYLGFGGGLIQGKLYSPDGNPAAALPDFLGNVQPGTFGLVGILAAPILPVVFAPITAVPPIPPEPLAAGVAAAAIFQATAPKRRGFPVHNSYPKFNNGLGQQMYKDWIKRAYDGGLRLMSALAINNWLVSSHGIKQTVLGTTAPIDDRASADAQIADIKRWVNEIENRRWVEIAYSPEDARRIIGENKLAVLLGVELDLLGNFAPNNAWNAPVGSPGVVVLDPEPATEAAEQRVRQLLRDELRRLHEMGVRQITPYHYVSGSFGGVAMFERLFNEQNRKFTGRNVVVESGAGYGTRYRLDADSPGLLDSVIRTAVTGHLPQQHSDASWARTRGGHINAMGLTRTGEILFEEVARLGMIMDIDHAGHKTADRLLNLALAADYPLLSSHSDFVDLAITGAQGFPSVEFRPGNDVENMHSYGTTLHSNLGHEGMGPRSKFTRISHGGGMISPIVSTYRRKQHRRPAGRTTVPNDNEGSSKTWAQLYLYASDVAPGRGVGMATDRGMINFISPRFGPNSAFMLSTETNETLSHRTRSAQTDAQTRGVKYDTPLNWRIERFKPSGSGAYDHTGKPWEHEDAWYAIAAFKAGRDPWALGERAEIPRSGDPHHPGRIENFVRGLVAGVNRSEAMLESDCRPERWRCGGATIAERYAAYCVAASITPAQLTNWRNDAGVVEHYAWMHRVWRHWHSMEFHPVLVAGFGGIEPQGDALRRHVFGSRDFDVNLDGVAHYGMLPDFLQDLKNVGLKGEDFSPLFKSAEQYVQMWEKAQRRSGELRSRQSP